MQDPVEYPFFIARILYMWELKVEYPDGRTETHVCENKAALIALCQDLGEKDTAIPPAGTKFTVSIV